MASMMVKVDGGTVWADDSGGDGPPLVLLHPGVGDSRIWEPVLAPLTARYRVIRYDARGFGQSPAPAAKFSLLGDLVAVLDHYGVRKAAFVGCSQGGGSALALALEQPGRVSALVLLCPGIPGFPYPEEDPDDPVGAEYDRAHAAGDLEQPDPPAFGRLDEIAVPAALMVGDADYPPLVESNRQAAARIPGCEFVLVPGMDHLPPLREPALVLDLITRTLARASW